MDRVTRYRAMAAFCRQRARMAGENEHFWLIEADRWAMRLTSESADAVQKEVTPGAGGRQTSDP